MSEYIEREAAQNALINLPVELEAKAVQRCIETIHNLPAADVRPKWISVEEALPSHGDAVLCVGDNGIGVAGFVCGDKWSALPWFFVDGEQETGVTHWMPLPEPPKEKTND